MSRWNSERFIRSVLRRLSRQRVALVVQPGNVWVIEKAVMSGENYLEEALRTCHMRGWVEPLANSIPQGKLTPDGSLPDTMFTGHGPMYRLTEAGWNVIHRTQEWIVVTCIVSIVTLFATIVGVVVTMRK